ncbi:unnamed protein product [Rotaria socialis]|uniref:L-Fucosyltransferase n=1 Tax=Rotaria socialis TaxID=392032 RepID=A0A818KYE7_9BILA|nr:unnamed protein product [Rotaria socialis]CAF4802164.1 unnamed protein product [Rotaria socialis]
MFMVASAYGLARLHSCHLYFTPVIIDEINAVFIFDLSSLLISTTKFNSIINSTAKTLNRIIKSVGCQYILELTRPNAISPGNIFELQESFSVGDDLTALSLCEHSIITGGTFGWWAAYLANGQVIHDKVYPSGCGRREYYYPSWFMIDGYVRAYKNSNNTLR